MDLFAERLRNRGLRFGFFRTALAGKAGDIAVVDSELKQSGLLGGVPLQFE
jgi:hypothetical protein